MKRAELYGGVMGNAGQRPPGRLPGRSGAAARAGSVRIIGGEWRGRRLKIPAGTRVRPTPDRVRETVFNWLYGRLAGARCIDLFAGSGVLGFEALSRGAREVWFLERDRRLAAALREHVALLGANARVLDGDARRRLQAAAAAAIEPFDLAFVDPPYDEPLEPWLTALGPLLGPRALIYTERPLPQGLTDPVTGSWWRRSRAGAVEFGLLAPGGHSADGRGGAGDGTGDETSDGTDDGTDDGTGDGTGDGTDGGAADGAGDGTDGGAADGAGDGAGDGVARGADRDDGDGATGRRSR